MAVPPSGSRRQSGPHCGRSDAAKLRCKPSSVRRFLTAAILATALRGSCFAASAGEAGEDSSCHNEMTSFRGLANGRAEEASFREARRTESVVDGQAREDIQLRWVAFGREFVVDLYRYLEDEGKNDRTVGYSGKLKGSSATELLVFSRWPSGAWDGEIKIGHQLFIIRARCDDRSPGVVNPRSVIFLEDYPEKPRL